MGNHYLKIEGGNILGPYTAAGLEDWSGYYSNSQEVTLGDVLPLPEVLKQGMCLMHPGTKRLGWLQSIEGYSSDRPVRVFWSEDLYHSDYTHAASYLYVPAHDLTGPNPEEYKWGYCEGKLYHIIRSRVVYQGKLNFSFTLEDPITRKRHDERVPERLVEVPEEFASYVAPEGNPKGKYAVAQSKFDGAYYLNTGSYYQPLGSGELFYTGEPDDAIALEGCHYYRTDDLTFGDPVLGLFSNEQIAHFPGYAASLYHWLNKNLTDDMKSRTPFWKARILLSNIRSSIRDRASLSIYQNAAKRDQSLLTYMRPGRALRFIFPELYDKDIEALVDKYRKDHPVMAYTVKRSFDADAFAHMYRHDQAPMQNPHTTGGRKSIGNSCMRHSFKHLPRHPCEAYASGEFEALWTETPEGRIASRLVVWHPPEDHSLHEKPQMGPVYGVCEYSIDLLEEAAGLSAVKYEGATWESAKMLYIPHNKGAIAPYLDHEQSLRVDGKYLIIDSDDGDDYEACDYNGLLGARHYCNCDSCGENIEDEGDVYSTDDGSYCYTCFQTNYFNCAEYDDSYPIDQRVTAWQVYRGWSSRVHYNEVSICEDASNNCYTECTNSEIWHNNAVTELYNGEFISPRQVEEGEYAECSDDGMWYPVTEMYPNAGGGFTAKVNFNAEAQGLNEYGEIYELA